MERRGSVSVRPAYRSGRRNIRTAPGRKSRARGFKRFLRRYYKPAAIAGGVLVAGGLCLALWLWLGGGNTAPAAQQTGTPAASAPEAAADETYDYSEVDADTLAGLAGTDESLFSDDTEMAEALLEEEGIRIGVTVGGISSPEQESILNRLEQAANAAEQEQTIYKTYYCNANGSRNQQLQDVRSLIKNGADVIVVGFTDAESFNMITMMAKNEGIPVVAFDAPAGGGFAVNVVSDHGAWGSVYGAFVADNLDEGDVAQVYGKADDAADAQRATAIAGALSADPGLTPRDALYANWDGKKAGEMFAELVEKGVPDAVITEEGMAEAILDVCVEKGKLPKVMCGDVTAGFIKKWYALKNGGIDVTPPAKDDGKKKKGDEPEPTPTPVMFAAQPGEFIVCAQPAPSGVGAAAFGIAVEMAKGRTLKSEGRTFEYTVATLITDGNLAQYYELVREQSDSYAVSDVVSDAVLDTLLNPPGEQPEGAAAQP